MDTLLLRFTSKYVIDPDTGCWLWTAGKGSRGYGQFFFDGSVVMAHRFAYAVLRGPIPDGLQIDHLCRVRHCVNPDHMEPVTPKENTLRGEGVAARQARQTHCKRGHAFDDGNTARGTKGERVCRACRRQYMIEYRRKHRGTSTASPLDR